MSKKIIPIYIIIFLVSIPSLSETIYIPCLPEMAESLNITTSIIELTLTSYLFGYALGILFLGNISDRYGRKPIFILGFIIYGLSCLGCYYSKSIYTILIFRFTQAFGASVGSVLGQSVVRDTIKSEERGYVFSLISMAMAFAPAFGPIIGSYMKELYNWNSIFLVLTGISVIALLIIIFKLPETHSKIKSNSNIIIRYINCTKKMLKDQLVLSYGFLIGSVNGILFAYFAESTFFFLEKLKISNNLFRLLSILIFIPLLLGGIISKEMHKKRIHYSNIIKYGIYIILLSSFLFFNLTFFNIINKDSTILSFIISITCLFFCILGTTMITPNCLGSALKNYGEYTGTAASIFGFYYFSIIALMTILMSYLHNDQLLPLPLFLLIQGSLMFIIFHFIIKKYALKRS